MPGELIQEFSLDLVAHFQCLTPYLEITEQRENRFDFLKLFPQFL